MEVSNHFKHGYTVVCKWVTLRNVTLRQVWLDLCFNTKIGPSFRYYVPGMGKYFPNFSKFLFPTRNFTISLLKMDLNIYRKTTFALKMWSKTHIWTSLQFLCDSDQKVTIFVEKLKKMQPPKMTFRSQLEPSIKSYECFMFLQNFGLEIIMDWWILERPKSLFFFQKPRKSKNALYYQKNLRFLFEIYQKVSIFVEKLKKMQPPKITFRSQIEPSIKSYEC